MNHRNKCLGALCLSLCVSLPAAWGQSKEAKVRYRDPGTDKEESVTGVIQKESLAGIVVKPPDKTIAATRVIDVEYPAPSFTTSRDLRAARNAEAGGDRAHALKLYQELLPKLTDSPLKRHTEYTIARLTAKLAEAEPGQGKAAIQLLLDYKKTHADSWEVVTLPDLLVPLQVAAKDLPGAQQTLADLAALSDMPAEVRLECNITAARLLVEERKYAEAERKLTELLRQAPAGDRQGARLRIALAECKTAGNQLAAAEQELLGLAEQVADPELKAFAYNALGDCQQRKGAMKQAMWSYLKVDVLYSQNKQEQARALYNLYKVFTALKDDKKAQQCRETLEKDKQLSGKYQDLMLKEK